MVQLTLGSFSPSSVSSSSSQSCSLGLLPQFLIYFLGRVCKILISDKLVQVLLSRSTSFFQRPFQRPTTIWFALKASTMKDTDTRNESPTICVLTKNVEEANRPRNSHKYPETWCSCQEVVPSGFLGNCATLKAKKLAMNDRGN